MRVISLLLQVFTQRLQTAAYEEAELEKRDMMFYLIIRSQGFNF